MSYNEKVPQKWFDDHIVDPENDSGTGVDSKINYQSLIHNQFEEIRRSFNKQEYASYFSAIEQQVDQLSPYFIDGRVKELAAKIEELEKVRDAEFLKLNKVYDRDSGLALQDDNQLFKIKLSHYRKVQRLLYQIARELGMLLQETISEVYE